MWVHFGSFQWTSITYTLETRSLAWQLTTWTDTWASGELWANLLVISSFLSLLTQVFHVSHFIVEVVFSISKCRLHFRNFLASEEGLAETRLRCSDTQALMTPELFNLDFYQSESSSGVWPSCSIKRLEAFPVTYLVMSKQNLITIINNFDLQKHWTTWGRTQRRTWATFCTSRAPCPVLLSGHN